MNILNQQQFGDGSNHKLFVIYQTNDLIFTYPGYGAYIEIFMSSEHETAFEVINVFDYAQGLSTVTTFAEFEERCEEWCREVWVDESANYIANCF